MRDKSQTVLLIKGNIFFVDEKNAKEIEAEIADLKARWPAHSVPPHMWQQLEELEARLERARKETDEKS